MTTPTSNLCEIPVVRETLLGNRPLRLIQKDVVNQIREGHNILAVMGTGQGKSVCFHIPALENAIKNKSKTIIFYPLRSLANDQYATLKPAADSLGVRIQLANGSITQKERDILDIALIDGSWDILIATPEFAQHHADRLGLPHNRPDLVVIDEAHHLYESRHRSAYRSFSSTLAQLGYPQTAAFTATARKDTFEHIKEVLKINHWIINPAVRENLKIVNVRNNRNKDAYVLKLGHEANGKTIVYCNSRQVTAALAEGLIALGVKGVACYNAKMNTKERRQVESDFRAGRLNFIIATSAFGEGIDIPDVRDVVLYHLNFDKVAFNQMSGRAGRDGSLARIHLLYGEADRAINDLIMQKGCPSKELLKMIYSVFRNYARGEEIRGTYAHFQREIGNRSIDAATISTALRIFCEVGLATVERDTEARGVVVNILRPEEMVDVTTSECYEENQATLESFEQFCRYAMGSKPEVLEAAISRPIYPDDISFKNGIPDYPQELPIFTMPKIMPVETSTGSDLSILDEQILDW